MSKSAAVALSAVAFCGCGVGLQAVGFERAGGGDRPLPELGPPAGHGTDCVEGTASRDLPQCVVVDPPGMRSSYRIAWAGLGLALAGATAVAVLPFLGRGAFACPRTGRVPRLRSAGPGSTSSPVSRSSPSVARRRKPTRSTMPL